MAKAVVNFTDESVQIDTSLDNVVMPQVMTTLPNGRALDVSGYSEKQIKGGHLIIKKEGDS